MSARFEARLRIAADHPSLPGHFPGEPVVPGVVLLDRLIAAAEQSAGAAVHVHGLPQVKFLAPLLPEEEATAVLDIPCLDEAPLSSSRAPASEASPCPAQSVSVADTQPHPSANRLLRRAALRFRVERAGRTLAQGAFDISIESRL